MQVFRSIFSRLMTTYIVVIVISLIVLSLLFSQLFQNFYLTERKNELVKAGRRINNIMLKYRQGQMSREEVGFMIRGIDRSLNAEIWLVDPTGLVYLDSRPGDEKWFVSHLEPEDMKQVLAADVVTRTGFFGNRFEVAVISVGVPLFLDNKVAGAIFLHSPIYGIHGTLRQVYRLIFIAAFITCIFAIIIAYYMSQRISKPLQQMSKVAIEMASGKFDKKVNVREKDEIGQLALSFNFMAQELGQLENMRREFIANVSHELRSPLTSIKGFIQGILDGIISGDDQKRYLKIVSEETNRLNRLINDLLNLAWIESGKIELNYQKVELNAFLRNIIVKFMPRIEEKGLTIRLDAEVERCIVNTDPDRLEQILVNLVDNAIKFTPPGKSIILESQDAGSKAVVRVMDQGVGIPEEQLQKIWERFSKVDKARTRSKGGTGLGLAIVKKLIEVMGETIEVTSTEGRGTEFTFTLAKAEE